MTSWAVSPFPWFGGKQRLARRLVGLLPSHLVYIEVFGGAAAVLLAKQPARLDVYNDRDESLVNFFRVLREEPDELERRLRLTPFSRSEFDLCVASWRNGWRDVAHDPIEWARRWYVRVEQGFAGTPTTVGWAGEAFGRRRCSRAQTNWTRLDRLPRIIARLRTVQIENRDWRKVLDRYDGADAVFYLDPPYLPETRKRNKQKGNRSYEHELTHDDHVELVQRVATLEASVLVSGYDSPLYGALDDAGFERFEFEALSAAANTHGADARRTEIVWRRSNETGERLFSHAEAAIA